MRVGIDIRKYHDYGIGTYIRNLTAEFQRSEDILPFHFADSALERELSVTLKKGERIVDNSGKYSVGELFSLSKKANRLNLDVFHAPHYTFPYGLRVPGVVTIHDIIHLRLKQYFSFPKRMYAYAVIKHACKSSAAIIVDSNFGKEELRKTFSVPEKKIHVIHLGVDGGYFNRATENERISFLRKNGITKKYILYTGSLKPHKNVPTLLSAFNRIWREHDIQLAFAGEKLFENMQLASFVKENGLSERIVDLGRIDQAELRTAYQSAAAVVLPSFYEGFGFSMIEAMASGVPAIGARATSIIEVVGDSGLLFNPVSDRELSECMVKVLTDNALRDALIQKGNQKVKEFTWERCVSKTIDVYKSVVR